MLVKEHRRGRADYRDAEIGRVIRAQRLARGLTQTELAERIGVTFQQVQKYEKGWNRVGAGRLARIAEALDVPVSLFFSEELTSPAQAQDSPVALLSTSGAMRLVRAYARIQDAAARQALISVAEVMAHPDVRPARKR